MNLNEFPLEQLGHTIKLVGGLYQIGNETNVLVPLPGENVSDKPHVVLQMDLDDWKNFLRQSDLVETQVLVQDPQTGKLERAIKRKCERKVSQNVRWQVYRRDDMSCRYCDEQDSALTTDHIMLWEDGGPSTMENMVACCEKCNRTRGNMKYPDWLKSKYYLKVSKALSESVREQNRQLLETLKTIKPMIQKKKKR